MVIAVCVYTYTGNRNVWDNIVRTCARVQPGAYFVGLYSWRPVLR